MGPGAQDNEGVLVLNNSYVKRPGDTLTVEFDFAEFVERNGPARYILKAEPGVTIATTIAAQDVMHLAITGGAIGRVYRFGFEATTDEGDSLTDMRILRIRDAQGYGDDRVKVEDGELVPSLTTEDGTVLKTEGGETVWAGPTGQAGGVVLVGSDGFVLVNGDGQVLVAG